MVSLKNIITHILQAHGFEVYLKDDIIHAEKDESLVTVGIYGKATVSELRKHAGKVSKEGGRHIICVLEASDAVEDEARNLGLLLWKRSDLEAEIGDTIVMRIGNSGDTKFSELIISPHEGPGGGALLVEGLGTEGRPPVMRSRLTLEDVKEITRKTIQGFKFELELVPHYLFVYSCRYAGKDGREVEKSGAVSVNALTGRYAEWAQRPELDSAPEHIIQLEPKIDQDNARKIAVHAIITLNTEFKEVIVERAHATIIERASFGPEEGSVNLESQSMVMLPVWCAEGKHGVMILDGVTGKVISEDYYELH